MAIREIGYRHWEGTYTSHRFRWWTVTKASLRATVYTKGRLLMLMILILFAWMYAFFMSLFWFFAPAQRVQDLESLRLDELVRSDLYGMLIGWQWMWGAIFSAVVGSRLVSNDLRSEALYIYLAKPVTRFDYVVGKLLACFLWLIPVLLLPPLWVYAAANGASNNILNVKEPGEIFFELLAVYLTFMLLCAAASVTISSITKRWALALIGWIGFVFLSVIFATIAADATNNPKWLYLSPITSLWVFAKHMFEQPFEARFDPAWEPTFWIIYGLVVVALAAFALRVWRLEVNE